MKATLHTLGLLGLAVVAPCWGCQNDFNPQSLVDSVRILAARADKPYAAPGDTVNLDVLAYDGRTTQTEPMTVAWVPLPCINPPGDLYYACYPAAAQLFPEGVDLTPALHAGTQFSFQLPSDIITTHGASKTGDPYGLAVAFAVACAGHVEYVPPPPGEGPNALPFGCFDSNHNRLGADDFVFAFALVYAFADRTNTNPVIESATFAGAAIDPDAGVTLASCTQSAIGSCTIAPVDIVVPDSSQEQDPGNKDVNGNILGEEIWVDMYLTAGSIKHDATILFDPGTGRVPNTTNQYTPPQTPGEQMLWFVVRDNRGGVNWMQVPIHAQ